MEKNAETILNSDQQSAVKLIIQFLVSDQKEFNLSGAAGTGKTFMMRYIINELLKEYENLCHVMGFGKPIQWNIDFTAITNKAADVLSQSIQAPVMTLHSYLGLRVKDNFTTGKAEIIRTDSFKVRTQTLLFADEGSMIDSVLYSHLIEAMDNSCKIIYVGDIDQLSPVGETLSPIYKPNTPIAELFQPMRNNTKPALMNLCHQFRNTVKTGKFYPIKAVDGVIDWLDGPTMKYAIDHVFKDENADSRILCYTNHQVNEYNMYIRSLRNLGNEFTIGENLLINSPYDHNGKNIPAETTAFVEDSDMNTEQFMTPIGPLLTYKLRLLTSITGPIWVKMPLDPSIVKTLLDHYKKSKDWHEFYGLKKLFPDLRPRDAITVHKAQGSTYDSVFIDLDNIGKCFDRDQAARLLYVAVSRAKNRIFLRGTLPNYYGGSPYYDS